MAAQADLGRLTWVWFIVGDLVPPRYALEGRRGWGLGTAATRTANAVTTTCEMQRATVTTKLCPEAVHSCGPAVGAHQQL